NPIVYTGGRTLIGNKVEILNDETNDISPANVGLFHLYKSTSIIPNFDLSNSTYWIRLSIKNQTKEDLLFLEIDNALIDTCSLFSVNNSQVNLLASTGTTKKYNERKNDFPNFVFDLTIPPDSTVTYLLKIKSVEQLLLSFIISSPQALMESSNAKNVISGIHMGVLLVMVLYNLFIFLSIRDNSYLY